MAVPEGVFTYLGQLTSSTDDNATKPITTLYPVLTESVEKTKLLPKKIPMIGDIHAKEEECQEIQCQVDE
eukprot:1148531-Ditylum_brightwellii.AAC.1